MIRIPFATKRADVQSLKDAIRAGADEAGITDERAALVIARFFEAVAATVAAGGEVTVPGFGRFGPYHYEPAGRPGRVQPRFVPARPFRNEVGASCPPHLARNRRMDAYRRSHHPSARPDQAHSRTFSALRAFRQHVRRQAGGALG